MILSFLFYLCVCLFRFFPNVCSLFVCLCGFFSVLLENFSLTWRRHYYWWMAENFDLCSALLAIEKWEFFSIWLFCVKRRIGNILAMKTREPTWQAMVMLTSRWFEWHWNITVAYEYKAGACHTYCDTGEPFVMVISEDQWHSRLLLILCQWSCQYLFLND